MLPSERYGEFLRKSYELPTYGQLKNLLFPPPKVHMRRRRAPLPPGVPKPPKESPNFFPNHPTVLTLKTRLQQKLASYHALSKTDQSKIPQRLKAVQEVMDLQNRVESHPEADEAIAAIFFEHVKARRHFFETLKLYLNQKRKKINSLSELFLKNKTRVYEKNSSLYVKLHTGKLFEKIDPYQRLKDDKRNILLEYKKWVAKQAQDDRDPAARLVDFFLSMDNFVKISTKYHSKDTGDYYKLFFADNGKIYAYYVRDSNNLWYHCSDEHLEKGLIPVKGIYHTLGGEVNSDGNYMDHRLSSRRKDGVDLFGAEIYVMRNDIFYTYQASTGFHSHGVQGKGVQSAGLIVGDQGKILAIDNKSGHYRPSWKHLLQAVNLIDGKGAFDPDALVGITHGNGCVFMRLNDFKNTAAKSFPLNDTLKAINRGHNFLFNSPRFADIRRLYENPPIKQGLIGDPIWDWNTAREEFLASYYPDLRAGLSLLTFLLQKSSVMSASKFYKESSRSIFHKRGGLEIVDKALREYHEPFQALANAWTQWDETVNFLEAVKALRKAQEKLVSAIWSWRAKHGTNAHHKRTDAVDKLLKQLLEDRRIFKALNQLNSK